MPDEVELFDRGRRRKRGQLLLLQVYLTWLARRAPEHAEELNPRIAELRAMRQSASYVSGEFLDGLIEFIEWLAEFLANIDLDRLTELVDWLIETIQKIIDTFFS